MSRRFDFIVKASLREKEELERKNSLSMTGDLHTLGTFIFFTEQETKIDFPPWRSRAASASCPMYTLCHSY